VKLVMEVLPVGVRGILLAALIASLMGSMESTLNSASSLFTMDIWPVRRQTIVSRLLLATETRSYSSFAGQVIYPNATLRQRMFAARSFLLVITGWVLHRAVARARPSVTDDSLVCLQHLHRLDPPGGILAGRSDLHLHAGGVAIPCGGALRHDTTDDFGALAGSQEVTDYMAPQICATFMLGMLWPRANEVSPVGRSTAKRTDLARAGLTGRVTSGLLQVGAFWGLMAGFALGFPRLALSMAASAHNNDICSASSTPTLARNPFVSIQYMYFSLVLAAVTVAVTVVVSLLTAPPKPENLVGTTIWTCPALLGPSRCAGSHASSSAHWPAHVGAYALLC
jgi:hypothetical protein